MRFMRMEKIQVQPREIVSRSIWVLYSQLAHSGDQIPGAAVGAGCAAAIATCRSRCRALEFTAMIGCQKLTSERIAYRRIFEQECARDGLDLSDDTL
jgi:hypothetical protein